MLNDEKIKLPRFYNEIKAASEKLQFNMLSDLKTGSLLRTLAASKPRGNFLELGTGTGLSLAWLAEGADQQAVITSVDNDPICQKIARQTFAADTRITFEVADGNTWLQKYSGPQFDLIFADAWPGKFAHLSETLALVKVGGFYFIDDLLPQPNWPQEHPPKVEALLAELETQDNFVYTTFNWSTGLMLFTKIKE